MSKLLIISSQAPYANQMPSDAIEAALGASNVGVEVSLLLMHKACYQLLSVQDNKQIGRKSIEKQLKVLPLYDIDCYVMFEQASPNALSPEIIAPSHISAIEHAQFQSLLANADAVLRF